MTTLLTILALIYAAGVLGAFLVTNRYGTFDTPFARFIACLQSWRVVWLWLQGRV